MSERTYSCLSSIPQPSRISTLPSMPWRVYQRRRMDRVTRSSRTYKVNEEVMSARAPLPEPCHVDPIPPSRISTSSPASTTTESKNSSSRSISLSEDQRKDDGANAPDQVRLHASPPANASHGTLSAPRRFTINGRSPNSPHDLCIGEIATYPIRARGTQTTLHRTSSLPRQWPTCPESSYAGRSACRNKRRRYK